VSDEPAPGRLRRVRGRLVDAFRRRVGRPATGHVPVDALRTYHRLRRRLYPRRYTDADPFALVWTEPERIRHSVLESAPPYAQWGRVVDGDWDRAREPFDERPVARAIDQRFREGRAWAETPLRAHFADQLERFGTAWGHPSMAGFDERCARIDRLYESMRADGYRLQSELRGGTDVGTPVPRFDEINVDVGREGEVLWRSYGQHRLAIAKLLGLEAVPTLVHRRHAEWQAVRDAVCERPAGRRPDHPDLRGGVPA